MPGPRRISQPGEVVVDKGHFQWDYFVSRQLETRPSIQAQIAYLNLDQKSLISPPGSYGVVLRRPNQLAIAGLDSLPHPRSPAARTFDWSSQSFLHPNSPAARYVDWAALDWQHPDSPSGRANRWATKRTVIDAAADGKLSQIQLAAEVSLNKHSDRFRDALPDTGLQIIYDRQVSLFREAYSFMKAFPLTDPAEIVPNIQRQIDWVHCHLQGTLTQTYQIAVGAILDEVDSLQVQTLPGEKAKLLSHAQALLESYYQVATESVLDHLADARKTGKQQELIQRWRTRMLACASAGTAVESPAEEAQAPGKKPPKKSSDESVKTWVAVQLIDDQGNPVPSVAYKVTLPDGSVMTGSTDDQGSVRFDEIDPGNCLVSFPEIHAKEWKPA